MPHFDHPGDPGGMHPGDGVANPVLPALGRRHTPRKDDQTHFVERVLEAFGRPCPRCTVAMLIILDTPHDREALDRAAAALGLPSRQSLVRFMQRHGFPPSGELRDWLRTGVVLAGWDSTRLALSAQAYAEGIEPSTLIRVVRRATGSPWHEVQASGLVAFLARMKDTIGGQVRCGTWAPPA